MAKRGRSGYSSTADDDARQDVVEEADPDQAVDDPATEEGVRSSREAEGEREIDDRPGNYQVVVPGTIIDGIYYPKSDCPPGQEMLVYLEDAQAQELANCGVQLMNIETKEEVVALKKEEPEVDDPMTREDDDDPRDGDPLAPSPKTRF